MTLRDDPVRQLRAMMLIRAFESALMRRSDAGFQLYSSGEEAVAVGLCAALQPGDQLVSSGRSIGPALARGLDSAAVMAELLGKSTGPCAGRGGRGHLSNPAAGFFGAHAVVGGNLAVAAGVALAQQMAASGNIVACVFGDGACGAGSLHETLNIAALWKLPLLFVCDNNQYSVSTPVSEALAPRRLSDLALPFGIVAATVDGMDVRAVSEAASVFADGARSGTGPAFLECISYRFASHSSATRDTRDAADVARWKERCPIARLRGALESEGRLAGEALQALEQSVAAEVAEALRFADASPYPEPAKAFADVL